VDEGVSEDRIRRVVVVGGGTAGWLSACYLAARLDPAAGITVTLVESPDIASVGVGEGTWPTMRRTLAEIGIDEAEFLLACDASFKQGSRFVGWRTGGTDDAYLHPFTPPVDADLRALLAGLDGRPFADVASAQARICALGLAPRQRSMPGYAGALNYAYHLDAGKLAALLTRQAARLGVEHVRDHVVGIEGAENAVTAVRTRDNGAIEGDLFLDCTGHAALLIGGHCGVSFVDRGDVLFNDRALAAQVPVAPASPIAAQTDATAHRAGWIWDIGLPTRRGIGCVYASAHMSDDEAEGTLAAYIARQLPDAPPVPFRRLAFASGHRARFWHGNVVAIGLSAGFLEPLEASAIVLIELSLEALLDNFPSHRGAMDIHAMRFNALFRYRWDRIVEFLKLHYVLSERQEPYWLAHRDPATIPARLAELITLWRDQPPTMSDFPHHAEVFPAVSFAYVLYGMDFAHPAAPAIRFDRALPTVDARARALAQSLPTNRAYLDALRAAAPPMDISA